MFALVVCGSTGGWYWPLMAAMVILASGCPRDDEPDDELVIPQRPAELGWRCGDKKCDRARGEDCTVCEADCGRCNGCQEMAGHGCPDARCEACVCKRRPACCQPGKKWNKKCVAVCKDQCGGCGRKPGLEHISTVTKCKDCDGCRIRLKAGCAGCKCEDCVCELLPACCGKKGRWGKACVEACQQRCRGCGIRHSGDEGPPLWVEDGVKPDGKGCRCHMDP